MAGKKTATAPDWTPALLMAQEFGIPPWEVERGCSYRWLRHWTEYKLAESMELERQEKKNKKR